MNRLNNFVTGDNYTTATTCLQAGTVRIGLHVTGAAILIQLADPDAPSGNLWQELEVYRAPGYYSLNRRCAGARVKSAAAGQPATIAFLELLTAADVG